MADASMAGKPAICPAIGIVSDANGNCYRRRPSYARFIGIPDDMGHSQPSRRQWLFAIRADPDISRTAATLAEWIAAHPIPSAPDEYICDQDAAGKRLRVSRSTLARATAQLLAAGYVQRLSEAAPSRPVRYRLTIERVSN